MPNYGWVADRPDPRDFRFSATRQITAPPPSADHRGLCSPVRDQGNASSCTGFALTAGKEYLDSVAASAVIPAPYSPLYVYYWERSIEGTLGQDPGASLRDGLKVLASQGVPLESVWPYDLSRLNTNPDCNTEAWARRISSYHSASGVEEMKAAIAEGHALITGMLCFASGIGDPNASKTGVCPDPHVGEQPEGGHATQYVAYYDDPSWNGGGYFCFKNSWSENWGDKGYGYLSYAFVEQYVIDAWVVMV